MRRVSLTMALALLAACEVRSIEVRQSPTGVGGESGTGTGGSGGFNLGGMGATGGTAGNATGGTGGSATGGTGGSATGGTGGSATGGTGGNPSCPLPRDEICNGMDDDCDGMVDDGYDLQNDPSNCGRCGGSCSYVHAFPACQAGQCALGPCFEGYADADHQPENGCECLFTNNRVEICDGADNDCDGAIDEDFDFAGDLRHCGGCFRTCSFAQAAASCSGGQCAMGACAAGYLDLNREARDGCEYRCTASNGGVEICDGQDNDCDGNIDGDTSDDGAACGGMPGGTGECRQGSRMCINGTLVCVGAGVPGDEVCDGKDNDCDGMTDEADPFLNTACYPVGVTGCDVTARTCTTPCRLGSWACNAGRLACQGMVTPTNEVCDNVDNDCDGTTDEGFDKQNDPRFCGGCNIRCEYPNAIALCQNATCSRGPCNPGWTDANGNAADGCEYQCSSEGVEVCDGRDNDCDNKTDAVDPDLQYPAINFCSQLGECGNGPGGSTRYGAAASYPVCATAPGAAQPDWICNYPATVETVPGSPNQIVTQETICDTKDNDCDGASDEHTSNRPGIACDDVTGTGECRRRGTYRCQADVRADTACDFTGVPVRSPEHETCDGKDNDCDGLVDESWDNPAEVAFARCGAVACQGVREALAQVGSSYVFRYEASRVDATGAGQGASSSRPCSRAAVMPWTLVNQGQAATACERIGMRLCTATEWTAACKGTQACTAEYFPYACTFDENRCNGAEQERGTAVAVGSEAMCTTVGGTTLYDMSGNVAEWTSQQNGTVNGKRIFILRGGSFNNYQPALRCDSSLLAFAEDYSFLDAGFRCCSLCAPGQAECAGNCVNLASSNSNCGACGQACTGGTTCSNGVCR
jgi:hypothetical protein